MKTNNDGKSINNDKVLKFPGKNVSDTKGKSPFRYLGYIFVAILIVLVLFGKSNSSFSPTNEVNEEPIILSNANNYCFSPYKEGYIFAKDGKVSCFNTKHELQWEISGSKTSPQITANGDKVLIYYNEDNLAILTDGSKTRRIKTPGNVMYGNVNSNGYVVLFLKESGLKNKICVYNQKLELLFYRDNPDKFVTYAALSDDNKSLVTCELITAKSDISSEFIVTNIRKNKIICNTEFENAIPAGCVFNGKKQIIALFETKMQCYSITNGKLKWQSEFEGKSLSRYAYNNGKFAFVFNKDDSANSGSEIAFYSKNGKNTGAFVADGKVHGIELIDNVALLTLDRRLSAVNTKGKVIAGADITYDIKEVYFIGNKKCALVLSNSKEAKLLKFS